MLAAIRSAARAAPRRAIVGRQFSTAAEHPAMTKYLAEEAALKHHAAGMLCLALSCCN